MAAGVEIRSCGERQLPLARAVLGLPLTAESAEMEVFLAVDKAKPAVAGAVVSQGSGDFSRVWLSVVPEYREQGIGRRLWEVVAERSDGVLEMETWQGVSGESEGFAGKMGFARNREVLIHEVKYVGHLPYFKKWAERFEARGAVPEGLRLLFGEEVPLGPVKRLFGELFGPVVQMQLGRMAASGVRESDWLFGVFDGEKLVSAVVGRLAGDEVYGEAYAVAPDYRRGWAQMVMKFVALDELCKRRPEIDTLRFSAGTGFSDTVKWAERVGARVVERKWIYGRKEGGA